VVGEGLKETNVESLVRRRKPLRLKGYDYSQAGAYFVTICAKDRKHLFGRVLGERMEANMYGRIFEGSWRDIPNHYRGIELDEFILMPKSHLKNPCHPRMFLSGVQKALSGFPLKTCGNDICDKDSIFEMSSNHIHGIVVILDDFPTVGAGSEPTPAKRHSFSEIMGGFKTFSARRINEIRTTPGTPVWQRGFFEHIIRNEKSLTHIREYIASNPQRWMLDIENPDRQGDPTDSTEGLY